MLFRARGQLFSRGAGLQRESGRIFSFERSCALRCFRPELPIEPLDSAPGLRGLLRPTFGPILLQGLLRFRYGHRDLLHLRSLQRFRWRAGLIGVELSQGNQVAFPLSRVRQQLGNMPADCVDAKNALLTGVSCYIGSDLSSEVRDGERCRNESCGDRGGCKSPRSAGPRLVARSCVFSQEILIARYRMPMRRRDLGWLAVFTDPFTASADQ